MVKLKAGGGTHIHLYWAVRVCEADRDIFLVQPILVELIGVGFPDETYQSQHYWIPYITNRNQSI